MRGEIASLPSFPGSTFGGYQDLEVKTMANCNNNCNCKQDEKIPQKVQDDFAYVCMSRALNKLIAIVIVCICLLFASNAAWLIYESQFEDVVTTTYEADAMDGGNAVINGEGSVNINGESEGNEN